jgi:hypothetical protein
MTPMLGNIGHYGVTLWRLLPIKTITKCFKVSTCMITSITPRLSDSVTLVIMHSSTFKTDVILYDICTFHLMIFSFDFLQMFKSGKEITEQLDARFEQANWPCTCFIEQCHFKFVFFISSLSTKVFYHKVVLGYFTSLLIQLLLICENH